ncbi:MAG: ribosome assembly cofactor RimP [Daejeonella sp.]|uniref:ribosome assembly cofactor RimP n=1 Tax=Daejeonella sp. TaxID=2805397 RepID=UPI002735B39C|nr:ribosome assembly cofactor RimP [Daejeonella sp.]MDP3467596.1 ribosome assembly cofactor RimP [Daejeonella sp.]
MNIEKRVIELVEEKIADRPDLFLVDVQMHSSGILSILVDGDNGVAISDCVAISRHVGFHLEEENAIEQAYRLEVSSPGIDTPLKSLRQFQKNINRSLKVKLKDGSIREGKLMAADDSGITIQESVKEKAKKAVLLESYIKFEDISETIVLVSFK